MNGVVDMSSFESLPPSYQLAPQPRGERAECGLCHSVREMSGSVHVIVGPLCVWCERAFDFTCHQTGEKIPDRDLCPFCLEDGAPCAGHAD